MENELLRRLKERVKRFQKEEISPIGIRSGQCAKKEEKKGGDLFKSILSSQDQRGKLPHLPSTSEKRKHIESSQTCQGSRRPEIHLAQILKLRSQQIVQTKKERLEEDLKRARDQCYLKTTEIANLLKEKEELGVKIQELTNNNLQVVKQIENLREHYEEKLRRKISSSELGQIEKLKKENESFSSKFQKYSIEKAELLRENNDIKDELYRNTAVMTKLKSNKEEMQKMVDMLAFTNLQLTDEKEELCNEYEEKLFQESQRCLLKGRKKKGQRRRAQSACETRVYVLEDKTEDDERRNLQMYQQSMKWLKASAPRSRNLQNPGYPF